MIYLNDVIKKYYIGLENELVILKGISLHVEQGEFISIVGASGSGKSTLMNILGALDRPTLGSYSLDGISIDQLDDNSLSEIRNKKIGFVFQTFNLIPRVTALSNVELPLFYSGISKNERREKAEFYLEMVGMHDRIHHMPNELSGGQKQRVAIARALISEPALILADEPTGALDSRTGQLVMDLFLQIHTEKKNTVALITHNSDLAKQTERIVTLSDGQVVSDKKMRVNIDSPIENTPVSSQSDRSHIEKQPEPDVPKEHLNKTQVSLAN